MKTLESGQDKIQKICDKLRHEIIEPAQKDAHQIIVDANKQAEMIINDADKQAKLIIKQARELNEQERNVFNSSLIQASKQALEALRQEIETNFFNDGLESILDKGLADPQLVANLINGIVKGLEKDGVSTDLKAVISRTLAPEQITNALLDNVRKKLKDQPLEIGQFGGGVQVKLVGKRMTVDLTDDALKDLLSTYARKDFRHIIFSQ